MPYFRSSACVTRRWILPALLLVTLFSFLPAFSPARVPIPQRPSERIETRETWLGMYMGARKIGHTQYNVVSTTYKGKPAQEMVSHSVVKLTVLGNSVEQETRQKTILDTENRPLTQTFDITSNGSNLHIEATYNHAEGKILCRVGNGGSATTQTIAIPPGANLLGDLSFLTAGQKLSVGQRLTLYYLDPLTVQLQKAQIEVTGRASVKNLVTDKEVSAFVVVANTPQGKMTSWETEEGDTLRSSMSIGPIEITMAMEPKARALDMLSAAPPMPGAPEGKPVYTPPADFAVATAITIDKPIQNPRRLRELTVTIGGIPEEKQILSDTRQKATVLPAANALSGVTARYEMRVQESGKSATLPIKDQELTTLLKPAALLEVGDAAIQKTAKEVRGAERDAYRVACSLRDWVSKQMTPDASIGVPRSATDIFKRRRGVCRDYATLYTALARAAGIPTRLCGGIVYADGRFYYHAWAESFVGSWVAFDPTLHDRKNPVDYVDATHIKFAQGDVTDMFAVASVIGKLRITVQETSP
jgi:hypothetical protein